MDVYVTAKKWMWKFAYPSGAQSIAQLYVPAGRPVRLLMTSRDVIHSFFVPEFRVKQDVIPGRYTTVWFEAVAPGHVSHPLHAVLRHGPLDHARRGGGAGPRGFRSLALRARPRRRGRGRAALRGAAARAHRRRPRDAAQHGAPGRARGRRPRVSALPHPRRVALPRAHLGRPLRLHGAARRRRRGGRRRRLPHRIDHGSGGEGTPRLRAADAVLPGPARTPATLRPSSSSSSPCATGAPRTERSHRRRRSRRAPGASGSPSRPRRPTTIARAAACAVCRPSPSRHVTLGGTRRPPAGRSKRTGPHERPSR